MSTELPSPVVAGSNIETHTNNYQTILAKTVITFLVEAGVFYVMPANPTIWHNAVVPTVGFVISVLPLEHVGPALRALRTSSVSAPQELDADRVQSPVIDV